MSAKFARRCCFLCLPLFLYFAAWPALLHAYCPVPEINAKGEYFKASNVFMGSVISEHFVDDKGDIEGGWFHRIAVSKTFRGPAKAEITVFTGNDSNRFNLEVGKDYLLFAYRFHTRLIINACGNSALVSEATTSLHLLQDLLDGKSNSEVVGWIAGETSEVDTSGIEVTLQGASRKYTAITDRDGKFHFSVPPGRYAVNFASKKYYVNADDNFWYDPHGFSIHPGECASLQLVSIRHKSSL